MIQAELPDKLATLFKPKRYKVLYGGRGGGKSMGVARALLILGMQKPLRILCAREFQNSIKDSVLKLLADQISLLGINSSYEVQQTIIKGKSYNKKTKEYVYNGTEFNFEGLKYNADKIKSYEGIDICWVEEAHKVSKSSWELLIPTIRKEDSEIWISFNPEFETDETYQRFVLKPPKESILININYIDNPWFPKVLEQERIELKERDPDSYLHVWEGHCRQTLEGAVYAEQIRYLTANNRITSVPYNPSSLVYTYWDLGWSDATAIWFVQKVGMGYHFIDYYENNQKDLQHYVKVIQEKPYVYGRDNLPHDARSKQLGTGMSIEEQLRELGRDVHIVPKLTINDGIAAARTIFPMCWFDQEKCADGITALKHYRYDVNEDTGQRSKEPLHDWSSHSADGFRYFAVGSKKVVEEKRRRQQPTRIRRGYGRI